MRSMLLTLSLLVLFVTPALAGPHPKADALDRQLQDLVRLADEEVGSIQNLLDAADRRAVRQELRRKTDNLRDLLHEISGVSRQLAGVSTNTVVVLEAPPPPPVYVEPPPPKVVYVEPVVEEGPVACDAGDFERVLSAVKAESFSDGKQEVLRGATYDRYFTAEQVKRMIGEFTFGDDKVNAAATMYPKVVDLQNWYLVYGAFTFDSDKDKLRQRVGE